MQELGFDRTNRDLDSSERGSGRPAGDIPAADTDIAAHRRRSAAEEDTVAVRPRRVRCWKARRAASIAAARTGAWCRGRELPALLRTLISRCGSVGAFAESQNLPGEIPNVNHEGLQSIKCSNRCGASCSLFLWPSYTRLGEAFFVVPRRAAARSETDKPGAPPSEPPAKLQPAEGRLHR